MYLIEKAKTEILLALKAALGKDYSPTLEDLEEPKDPALGDLAFPCFKLAKGMQRNPAEISRELAAKIAPTGFIKEARAIGPYVNFVLAPDSFYTELHKQIVMLGVKYGALPAHKRTIMVEYSGFNTHKPVHIGHVRNVLLGASLVRLMRAQGIKVIAADFVNDLGLHVAQWLWGYQKSHAGEKLPKHLGKYLQKIYVESVQYIEAHDEVKSEITEILKKLEAQDPETMKLWKKTRSWSLKDFKQVHKELGADFDTFYAESQFVEARKKIIEELLEKGIAEHSQGAVIVNLEKEGLGVFLIRRSDGTALYATTDLPLALQKFKDYDLDASFYIVDARQKQHFAQLFETLKHLGCKQEFKHIAYEFVTLPEGAMSSRKGTVVLYEDFKDEMVRHAVTETRQRHPEWSRRKIEKAARGIAFGALKFDLLKQDPEKTIVFNIKEAMSFDGFSGPYLQYTTARIAGILRKAKKPKRGTKPALLFSDEERQLILALARYPEIVREAAATLRPSLIAHYLFKTAKLFAAFYEKVPVATASDVDRALHLSVINDLLVVFRSGLGYLGIELLSEM